MHNITLNFPQFMILLIFVYVFSYYWTPKQQYTDEYLTLLAKYNKVSEKLERKIQKSILKQELAYDSDTVIGKTTSAHGGKIKPVDVYYNENTQVYQTN